MDIEGMKKTFKPQKENPQEKGIAPLQLEGDRR